MRARRKFTPSLQSTELEKRLVLSGYHGPNRMGAAVLLHRFQGPARAFRLMTPPPAPASVAALVDRAYQSFQQDYGAVRATYLSSVSNGTATSEDKAAFDKFTTQRVGLLAQEVTNSFLVYAASTSRGKKSDSALPLVIRSISGQTDNRMNNPRGSSSLVTNLTTSTPAPDASPTTVALSTIAQDNAIEASRVSTLNGVTIIRSGSFGSRAKH